MLILSLDAITKREQSLGLFHALGKVLYNKRGYLLSSRRIRAHITGIDDPGVEEDHAEAIVSLKALPPEETLPSHLDHLLKSRLIMQYDVGSEGIQNLS